LIYICCASNPKTNKSKKRRRFHFGFLWDSGWWIWLGINLLLIFKSHIMSKKELAEKLGFDFEEVKDILSEETLKSFEQKEIRGGDTVFDDCAPQVSCEPLPQDNTCISVFELQCMPLQSECN
jgi:hypothetical protein